MRSKTNDRSLELEITAEAKNADSSDVERHLVTLQDEDKLIEERYRAYLVIFVYHRRRKDIGKCIQLYNDYKELFGDRFLTLHFYAIALKETGSHTDLEKAVFLARKAVSLEPENSEDVYGGWSCLSAILA